MTARELQEIIRELILEGVDGRDDEDEAPNGLFEARSYEEAGILTTDMGLVIEADDGSEFQLTIVRSRAGDAEEVEP